MSGHLNKVGRSLESVVKNYNAGVGSFEGRVLSRARKFAEYELPNIDKAIDEIKPVEGRLAGCPRGKRTCFLPGVVTPEQDDAA